MSIRFHDREAHELAHIDLEDDRLSYPEAALYVGLPEATIRQWKSRDDLKPIGKDDDGRLRFRPVDVLRVEVATRLVRAGRKRNDGERQSG